MVLEDGWLQKKYLFDALRDLCRIINGYFLNVLYLNRWGGSPSAVEYTFTFTTLHMALTENETMDPFSKPGYGFLDKAIGDLDGALRRIEKMREKKKDSVIVK